MITYQSLIKQILILTLLCLSTVSQAKKLPGYIITENNDTIYGEIKVHDFNRRTGGFVFNTIDLEWCYLQVAFRKKGKFFFKYFNPNQVKEYSFNYKEQQYHFHSFLIQTKGINNGERNRHQFLNLIKRTGTTSIYRRQNYATNYDDQYLLGFFTYPYNIVPQYTYYQHKNGSARIINHGTQSIKDRSTITKVR